MTSGAAGVSASSIASLKVIEIRNDIAVVGVPGTDYQLHLVTQNSINVPEGKRVKGEIHAQALKMHRSDTGGQFIEPVFGTPRIVQGMVEEIDVSNNRVLFFMPIPVWVTLHEDNSIEDFHAGELWNGYVESGMRLEIKSC